MTQAPTPGAGECIRRPHATWTACRCARCVKSNLRVRKLHEAGLLAPSREQEAWAELVRLEREGWSAQAVASAAGLSPSTVQIIYTTIRRGGKRHLSRTVAIKILNRGTPTQGLVPALGAARRLQALSAMGWALSDLAARTALAPMAISRIRSGDRRQVHAVTDQAIRRLYDELEMQPGPSATARRQARDRGWLPPLAWENIDDPDGLADVA